MISFTNRPLYLQGKLDYVNYIGWEDSRAVEKKVPCSCWKVG
jgi:hypothetical protein